MVAHMTGPAPAALSQLEDTLGNPVFRYLVPLCKLFHLAAVVLPSFFGHARIDSGRVAPEYLFRSVHLFQGLGQVQISQKPKGGKNPAHSLVQLLGRRGFQPFAQGMERGNEGGPESGQKKA